MTKREKIDSMFESVGKMVSNLQQTTLDEVIHSVRYNFDYYLIHARLNYYSNSKNPRVIHTRFQNEKLTTLRTNPHDPFFVKPGEFLTLAKREPDPDIFDDLLSYYQQGRYRKTRTAPVAPQLRDSYCPEYEELDLRKSRRSEHSGGDYLPKSRPKRHEINVVQSARGHRGNSRGHRSSQAVRYGSHGHSRDSGFCPIHLIPHPSVRDSALAERMLSSSRFDQSGVTLCPHQTAIPRRKLRERPRSNSHTQRYDMGSMSSAISGRDSSRHRDHSSRRDQRYPDSHAENDFTSRKVSKESKDKRRVSGLVAFLNSGKTYFDRENGGVDQRTEHAERKKTRKIKRRLVRRVRSTGSGGGHSRGRDESFLNPDASSNLIDISSYYEKPMEEKRSSSHGHVSLADLQKTINSQILLRPKSSCNAREVQTKENRPVAVYSTGKVFRPNLKSRQMTADKSLGHKKRSRFRELEVSESRRPSSSRTFKGRSLRRHANDSRCLCSKCDDTKVWQVVLSDISLSAARQSTGSDGAPTDLTRRPTLRKMERDVFAENLRQGRARFHSLPTMMFLDSMDDWYD